jgi:hypothetical protein
VLNCFLDSLTATRLLSIDPTDTAGATSAFVDVSGYEGQIAVIVTNGIIGAGGSVTYTFATSTVDEGTSPATIVPIGGALAVANEANEPLCQVAVFDVSQLRGFLSVIGTVATDAGPLTYVVVGQKKYATT